MNYTDKNIKPRSRVKRKTFPPPNELNEIIEKRVKRKYSYPSANCDNECWEEHIIIKKYHGPNPKHKHKTTNQIIHNENNTNESEPKTNANDNSEQITISNILMVLSNKIIKIICYLGVLSCAII
jgi:hypothetical protein